METNEIYQETVEINGERFAIWMHKEEMSNLCQPEFTVDLLGYPDIDVMETFFSLQEAFDWMNNFSIENQSVVKKAKNNIK